MRYRTRTDDCTIIFKLCIACLEYPVEILAAVETHEGEQCYDSHYFVLDSHYFALDSDSNQTNRRRFDD